MAEPELPTDGPIDPSDDAPLADVTAPGATGGRTRTWIVVALVAVAVAVGAATAVLLMTEGAVIHDGPGTATFTWRPVHQDYSSSPFGSTPQPFSADVDGHPLTGTARIVVPSGADNLIGSEPPTGPAPAFRYRGLFAGTPFALTLTYTVPSAYSSDPATVGSAAGLSLFSVTGTYGNSPVHATVSAPQGGPASDQPAHVTGTIGHWRVTGTFTRATASGSQRTVTAHFVVSG